MSIEYKTRTQLVVESLREKILSGEIKAGQPLRQAALAEELNVSRIPIREALLQLEAEGLVAFEPHKGATATELNLEQVDELFDLRAMLEGELLRLSIPNLSDDQLDEAALLLTRLDKALGQENAANTWSELNSDYHNCLYSAANRPQTQDLVNSLNKNADRYIRMHLLWAGGISKAESEHNELLALCKARKVEPAVALLKEHILGSRDEIKAFLAQREQTQ
ncbi:GntR family transcriptional regulator [Thalassotalea agarivorans]|uniref:Transcriptional regulator, GntR family n=1 Tax=Thalassotalea agarivorans TaxID=349064 RepID=A0A1I0ACA1_THASX|nr:GntR family transcriptional regulator [Thalassotalea agarivorans]SES91823.1 transcriptional regulator, GntR family [Thalassotalea agarivorans]